MLKRIICFSWFICFYSLSLSGKDFTVFSPDKNIRVVVRIAENIHYSLFFRNKEIIKPSAISLTLNQNMVLGNNPQVKSVRYNGVKDTLYPPVRIKRKEVVDHYNQMTITFKNNFGLVVRVFDDGAAYRFRTGFKDSIRIFAEEANFSFTSDDTVFFPQIDCSRSGERDCFHTSFEEAYKVKKVSEIKNSDIAYIPVLVNSSLRPNILITEADLDEYPGMFLTGSGNGSLTLTGRFAPYPLKLKTTGGYFKADIVTERAEYIAKTKGTRDFPWRVIIIAEQDRQLLESDMVYRLGGTQLLEDVSWLKPGKSTSEWLNDNNIYGVDFKSGLNTDTYKYYIDFASNFGLVYVLFDAGWSEPSDIFKINPDMDMEELTSYARKKGTGLVLWTSSHALSRQMDRAMDQFERWGIKGIMVDFMDRDDQLMVKFYKWVAEETAKHHMFVDYHGAYKPDGLYRKYPNAITQEGAMGLEYYKFSSRNSPENEVILLFTRMVAGPYDYEPGCMQNITLENYRPMKDNPASLGTRIHQLALCILIESPYGKLGGNVSDYIREPGYTKLIADIPTVWDETICLDAKVADYAVMARKASDGDWYIGAITDWTPRTIEIDFSFLEDDKPYQMEIYRDGINADRYPSDHKHLITTISKNQKTVITMAPGGGWVGRIFK